VCRLRQGILAVSARYADCRRCRRRRWQRAKRQADADYRDNQTRAQRVWAGENSAYWRAYRSGHPEYAQADRERAKCGANGIASGVGRVIVIASSWPHG
jgi:hypothetical protein